MAVAAKRELRRLLQQQRASLEQRAGRSAAICARLAGLALYQRARVIHCYLPIRSEVDTRPLIAAALAAGMSVVVPVLDALSAALDHAWLESLDPAGFDPGPFGTLRPRPLRPAPPGCWDLVVTPLVGFDRRGYRLGYGKGYYDRLLASSPAPAIGVAFACQEVAAVPHEPHDIPLPWIVTEDELIACQDDGALITCDDQQR